jgi:hypothetical protein
MSVPLGRGGEWVWLWTIAQNTSPASSVSTVSR